MLEKEREHFKTLTQSDVSQYCTGELPPQAEAGIRLFNQMEYWHAHEKLEQAWLEESSPLRNLYKGILQVGVGYFHVQNNNFRGAMKMQARANLWLHPWPDDCRTVDVGRLKSDFAVIMLEVKRLGPNELEHFDQQMLKPIQRTQGN